MPKIILAVAALVVLMTACVVLGPNAYNYNLHPLARFSASVAVGHECDDLERSIAAYVLAHPGAAGGRARSNLSGNIWPTPTPDEGYLLYLSDESIFDDPQFEAVCLLKDGSVARTAYVAD